MKEYVLVSQGIEIYRTKDKSEAERIMHKSNGEFYAALQKALENNEDCFDNEVYMYEEDI